MEDKSKDVIYLVSDTPNHQTRHSVSSDSGNMIQVKAIFLVCVRVELNRCGSVSLACFCALQVL